ncbi:MAG TPA: hypothetical protein VNB24_08380 [Acidimicrobiales bacterium]|nr:hypothetical protein [Acidimicrobiales bacterium]
MTTHTLLLSLHIAAIASWLGADVMQHAARRRWVNESPDAVKAWARMQFWLHDRYYAVVAVLVLATGIALVVDGGWSWSSNFIWVGIATVIAGGMFGGVGLKGLAKKRIDALESGDAAGAESIRKRAVPIEIFLTLFVLVTIVAMVHRWGGSL